MSLHFDTLICDFMKQSALCYANGAERNPGHYPAWGFSLSIRFSCYLVAAVVGYRFMSTCSDSIWLPRRSTTQLQREQKVLVCDVSDWNLPGITLLSRGFSWRDCRMSNALLMRLSLPKCMFVSVSGGKTWQRFVRLNWCTTTNMTQMGEDTQERTNEMQNQKEWRVEGEWPKGCSFCSVYYTPPFSWFWQPSVPSGRQAGVGMGQGQRIREHERQEGEEEEIKKVNKRR